MSAAYTDQERLARETYRAENLSALGMDGVSASFITPEGDFEAVIPIPGEHNVYNALAAAAVGQSLGLDLDEIKAGMETASTISGRAHFLHLGGLLQCQPLFDAGLSCGSGKGKGTQDRRLGRYGRAGRKCPRYALRTRGKSGRGRDRYALCRRRSGPGDRKRGQ